MDPDIPDLNISDVVISTAGRDQGKLFYIVRVEQDLVYLANGKDRPLERPKPKRRKHIRKVLRSETRVARKILDGDKVLNSELRKDLAFLSQELQSNNLGG